MECLRDNVYVTNVTQNPTKWQSAFIQSYNAAFVKDVQRFK